jgi:hypothetical protein
MRLDLLKIIKSSNDITHAFILTHNIDFLFVQAVVVPALRKCGSPALTIFADSQCAEESYQSQYRFLSDLGIRYRVVPITMQQGFRFHPKAVFLSGPKQGTLLVGSGNLTFGGWRENGEIWTRHDAVDEGLKSLWNFRNYLRDVVDLAHDSAGALRLEVEEAFDPESRTWAASLEAGVVLLGRAGKGRSMLSQMASANGDRSAEHLYVCAPFFDQDAEALKSSISMFAAKRTSVLVQSGYTNLLSEAAERLEKSVSLRSVKYEHPGENIGERRIARLHAKFIAIESGDDVLVFSGSANCSRAALTIPGAAGNAELVSLTIMPAQVFRNDFLSELVFDESAPILLPAPEEVTDEHAGASIRILSAHSSSGRIDVRFTASDGLVISGAVVDGLATTTVEVERGSLRIATELAQPRTIFLVADFNGEEMRSPRHWIDDEAALRVSARGRSFAESISGFVRQDFWGVGAWTNVLAELYKHLEYMPKASPRIASQGGSGRDPKVANTFTWDDVFSSGYGLSTDSASFVIPFGLDDRVGGLRSMLLRWFGVGGEEPEIQATPAKGTEVIDDSIDDNQETDRPVALTRRAAISPLISTPKERNKALKLVEQVTNRMAAGEFLSERPPGLLGRDLKVVALLLRAGLSDGWLTPDEFFDSTLKIWLPLFFNAQSTESTGWLEQRYLTDPAPEEFASLISSVELSAALACWALSVEEKIHSPAHARFMLASVLGVARLPWLWQTGGNKQIARQVSDALACMRGAEQVPWSHVESRWLKLIRRGYALNRLQLAIGNRTVIQLSAAIEQGAVSAGELLWQGALGFCIANTDCIRGGKNKCEVLLLQHGNSKKNFSSSLLVPLTGLLTEGLIGEDSLPLNARQEISSLLLDLRRDLEK